MEKNYSRAAAKWLICPLYSILAWLLVTAILLVISRFSALTRATDFFYFVWLLIFIIFPVIFAVCGLPALIFSIIALWKQGPMQPVIGKLLISGIYLAAGLYFSYHLTYYVLFQ
jgi:hypothetical protein